MKYGTVRWSINTTQNTGYSLSSQCTAERTDPCFYRNFWSLEVFQHNDLKTSKQQLLWYFKDEGLQIPAPWWYHYQIMYLFVTIMIKILSASSIDTTLCWRCKLQRYWLHKINFFCKEERLIYILRRRYCT